MFRRVWFCMHPMKEETELGALEEELDGLYDELDEAFAQVETEIGVDDDEEED